MHFFLGALRVKTNWFTNDSLPIKKQYVSRSGSSNDLAAAVIYSDKLKSSHFMPPPPPLHTHTHACSYIHTHTSLGGGHKSAHMYVPSLFSHTKSMMVKLKPATDDFCWLLITFTNNLDPDQAAILSLSKPQHYDCILFKFF